MQTRTRAGPWVGHGMVLNGTTSGGNFNTSVTNPAPLADEEDDSVRLVYRGGSKGCAKFSTPPSPY